VSCCEAYDRGAHCDCKPCGRCEDDKHSAPPAQTAYDKAQAEHVPIVDNPEEFKRQRDAAGWCHDCNASGFAHMSNCPRLAAAFAALPPQPLYPNVQPHKTDTDRRLDELHKLLYQHSTRLDAALRRIEALELEVARLKGASAVYGVPPNASSAYAQAIDRKLENIRQSTKLVFDANGSQDRLKAILGEMTLDELVRYAGSGDDNEFAEEINRRRDRLFEAKEQAASNLGYWQARLESARESYRRRYVKLVFDANGSPLPDEGT
jgi:FtsZ-binding cell division protein ZapB